MVDVSFLMKRTNERFFIRDIRSKEEIAGVLARWATNLEIDFDPKEAVNVAELLHHSPDVHVLPERIDYAR